MLRPPAGIVLAVLLLLAPPALAVAAAAAPVPAPGRPISATLPGAGKVSISGDHFTVDDTRHEAVFSGKVVVVQDAVTVHADKVIAHYGAGGATSISTFEALGNVVLITRDQTATGNHATFEPKTHTLVLTGNVVVTNKTGRVQSNRLVVDLRTKKSVFTSKGGRVTGVFSTNE
jgi:lipopolysaccharide export system protein LptA